MDDSDGAPNWDDRPVTAAELAGMSGDLITDFRLVDEAGNLLLTGNVNPDEGPTGLGASIERQFQLGVKNGDFEDRPVAPDYPIGVDNVLPHWTFAQVVGDVLGYSVGDAAQGSGYSLELRIGEGAAADEARIEQIVSIGSSRVGGFPDLVEVNVTAGAGNTGTFTAAMAIQYLDANGAVIGSEVTASTTIAAAASGILTAYAATAIAPTSANALRIRVSGKRGAAAITATGTLQITEVRRTNRTSKQVFTADGTWTKPAGASWVQVTVIGGGGGGGSGRGGGAGTNRGGGGGGSGAGLAQAIYRASDLPATVAITVSAGGAGGAGRTSAGDGNAGTDGSYSSFGALLSAQGGSAGGGGTAADGGAAGIAFTNSMWIGGQGAVGGTGVGGTGGDASIGSRTLSGGGGGGGCYDSNNSTNAGGTGGVPSYVGAVVTAPASDTAGANITGSTWGGTAGGGGSSNQPGKSGGYGSGGGGGGGGPNASGAGGDGGSGYVAIIAW